MPPRRSRLSTAFGQPSARSASAATASAEIPVRHRKSPGSHRRWSHGRHGRSGNLRRRADEPRASKRLRSHRQRRSIQPHNRHARRSRDVQRSAVASDVQRRPPDERAQLCEIELAAFDNGRALVGGRAARARLSAIAAAAAASDGPDVRMIRRFGSFDASRHTRSTNDADGQRRNGLPALTCTTINRIGRRRCRRRQAGARRSTPRPDPRASPSHRSPDLAARCRAAAAHPTG